MANQAYMGVWCKDFSEERMLEHLRRFLETVPFSATRPGFTHLSVRAVDPSESPVLDQDLRAVPLDAAGIVELAQGHLHADSSYEVRCHWDLWVFDSEGRWKNEPQPMQIVTYGEEYDDA